MVKSMEIRLDLLFDTPYLVRTDQNVPWTSNVHWTSRSLEFAIQSADLLTGNYRVEKPPGFRTMTAEVLDTRSGQIIAVFPARD